MYACARASLTGIGPDGLESVVPPLILSFPPRLFNYTVRVGRTEIVLPVLETINTNSCCHCTPSPSLGGGGVGVGVGECVCVGGV